MPGFQRRVYPAVEEALSRGAFGRLDSWYRGSQRRTRTAEGEARIMEATRQGPTDGMSHWSSYRLAKKLGLGIQPQRSRGYMVSHDPLV
jgi:hypothetical protein